MRFNSQSERLFPVQAGGRDHLVCRVRGQAPESVVRAAYEVYAEVHGPQDALLDPETCRGGFGTNELIAYLYARAFPRSEWRQRVREAEAGLVV